MKAFTETLRELQRGSLLDELEESLTRTVAAVRETGKAGELKLSIKIKPASKGDNNQLFVDAKVTTSEPKADRPTTLFFANDANELLRKDPRQHELELRTVPVEPRPLKEAK